MARNPHRTLKGKRKNWPFYVIFKNKRYQAGYGVFTAKEDAFKRADRINRDSSAMRYGRIAIVVKAEHPIPRRPIPSPKGGPARYQVYMRVFKRK